MFPFAKLYTVFGNIFRIAFRQLLRNKTFSLINILGLAFGMAGAVFVMLWINHEVSYDRFHGKNDRLMMAYSRGTFEGKVYCWNQTAVSLGPALQQSFPEFAHVARIDMGNDFLLDAGNTRLKANGMHADPAFLNMVNFPLLQGDKHTALNGVNQVVITESLARKLFGNGNALDKMIRIGNKEDVLVTGVMKDLPLNTLFNFEYILPWAFFKKSPGYDDNSWTGNNYNTLVELKPGVSREALNRKIVNFINEHEKDAATELFLYPLSDMHLYNRWVDGRVAGGRIEMVKLMGIIAGLILLIACINFMNLSTAGSEKRAKEVGVRKTMGAMKFSLIGQFLLESILTATIAGILAFALVYAGWHAFTSLVLQQQLSLPETNAAFWLAVITFILITGILAGSYPAFYLSAFRPVKVLKGAMQSAGALITPRKVLVVIQFSVAMVLIVSTLIVQRQVRYAQQRDPGYERQFLAYHWFSPNLKKNYDLIKQELLNTGAVMNVNKTSAPISSAYSNAWAFSWPGSTEEDKRMVFDMYATAEDFAGTMGVKILAGRDIDVSKFPTDSTGCLLSESAVKAMRLKDPLGQTIRKDEVDWHVVGVFRDFIWGSPYENLPPMFVKGGKGWFNTINFRLNPDRPLAKNLATIEGVFKKFEPAYPFEPKFVDADYARKFNTQERTARIAGLFAALSVILSCLGLFGLATFMAINKTKEISIRKILGATTTGITMMLSKDFLKLVLLAIALATPLAWWAMHRWLENFSYRINPEWEMFALAGLGMIAIALLSVGFQSVRAALANPSGSLRAD